MLKKLIAILLITISAAVFCADKYAILIAGNFDDSSVPTDKRWNDGLGNNTEFWNDLYLQWEMLYRKGYAKENITVIFSNELDMWQEEDYDYIARRYRAANATDNERETITNYSATKQHIADAVDELNLKIQPDDFLYVWAMSHGGSPTQSSLYFNDGEMTDAEFAGLFSTITANKKVFVINANYAGGFLTALQAENSFVQVSSTDTKSYRADDRTKEGTYIPFLENEEINGRVYYHGEIGFHNYCASSGYTPAGLDHYNGIPLSDADVEGGGFSADGLISVLESYEWSKNFRSTNEIPDSVEPLRIGYHTSLKYPTILRDAWHSGRMVSDFGLRGICAVTDEVILEYDDFFNWTSLTFEENSKTTVFENKGIHVGRASSLTFESNSTITGMGNSYITTGGWSPILRFSDCRFENISVTQSWDLYANGTLQFNSAQLLSRGQFFSEGEIAYFDFMNNSLFEITGGNFKKEIDGELYMSVNYDPELEEESKSLFYLDITIDNSNLLLKNVYITEQPFLWAKKIKNNSTATIENDVVGYVALDLHSNSKFVVAPNARFAEGGITLYESTGMIIEENGLFAGSLYISDDVNIKLHNNARLKNSLVLTNDCEMELQKNSHFTMEPEYSMNFKSGSILRLLDGSEFIVPDKSALNFDPGSQLIVEGDARIIIQGGGSLASNQANFSGTDGWRGIEAQVGSSVRLTSTYVRNAQTGLSAIGADVSVNSSYFVDCYNGVSLTNCMGYELINNSFSGMNSGYDFGISLTECGGEIKYNTVTNFGRGVVLTLSSTNLVKNKIYNNRLQGVYVTGYNIPQMINTSATNIERNNVISNNGASQVNLVYHANLYLNDGYNNIYSEPIDEIPSVPCINTVGWQISTKALLPNIVKINSERNYWGHFDINADNFEKFFGVGINSIHQGYNIDYEPYATKAFTVQPGTNQEYSSNEPSSPESKQLSTAMRLESSGNYKASIKLYERIIERYEDSPEAYVAAARLPYVYLKAEKDTEPLIATYGEALEDENISHKKFYQQMKISTHTKVKNFDEAITIAEEMKNEAQAEEEIMLADISIEIANIMKGANSKAKSNDDQIQSLNKLLAKLHYTDTDDEPVSSPSDITESVLPEATELFQNYPNPFNPVTQIKFALSKTADVKLSVYNISGQLVSQLASGTMNAGVHAVDFDGSRINSGVYYYTLETDGNKITKKMVLTK